MEYYLGGYVYMNGDGVKIPPPVATTVYANVPVDTAVLATNLYGPTTQLAAPAATHIPLIATAAGPQPPHHQALQVAAAPGQHQQLIAAHTAAAHPQQPTLQTVQAAAAAAAVAAATPQHTAPHQIQGHPQQAHLQYAHQQTAIAAGGQQGPTVTTTTIDNTEYTVMNGAITQDGTVVCYSQDDLQVAGVVGAPVAAGGGNVTNLVAVDQMSGTPVTAATAQQQQQQQQQHNVHAQHHVILNNGPPPSATTTLQQQQSQQQQVVAGNSNNTNISSSSNSSGNTGDNSGIPLEQLKQMLATQLEYYFSR
ncbi:hypothetical protein FF38_11118 [Lucilia cuprina]|uniref:Uncharacterized protein n=1 Tax=Lucilia cuprina TaxID=7375 RepID=A0A0L0CJC1_LUCCU|nr:hypothetical protein CVS40_10029 [Lucilia cuprina]KNC32346.1 hypothetical protein FF38_11118 [Lucilia cuprina]